LKDPAKLFNSSLDGNVRRAIDIHEGKEIDANAFKALIRAAVAFNTSGGRSPETEVSTLGLGRHEAGTKGPLKDYFSPLELPEQSGLLLAGASAKNGRAASPN
jgi:hypothetical protein